MEEEFESILNPTKSAEEAFNVDLAERLENYLQMYVKGDTENEATNFNEAALMIQGSSHLYSKKVEYLYELASNLHDTLTKHKPKGDVKKDSKEKGQRQSKTEDYDLFCSTEIKVGKNLSCFRKKKFQTLPDGTIADRSSEKIFETKYAFVPPELLPLEGDEKGDPFYNTRGELIGNRNDFALNQSHVTRDGWLLLPTMSHECITDDFPSPSASIKSSSADEGYPASSGCPSVPSSQAVSSSQPGSSQQSDEGIGSMATSSDGPLSQPSEQGSQSSFISAGHDVSMENIPLDDSLTGKMAFAGSKHQQPSTRKVLQPAKQKEEPKDEGVDLIAVIRPIEKNNIYIKTKTGPPNRIYPASIYCAENFFSVNTKKDKNDDFTLDDKAFANNTKFQKRIKSFKAAIKAAKSKAKKKAATGNIATDEDEVETEESDTESIEGAAAQEYESFTSSSPLTIEDFDENPVGGGLKSPKAKKTPVGETSKVDNMNAHASIKYLDGECSKRADEDEMAIAKDNVQTMKDTVAMNKRVRDWQKTLKPFLGDINQREKFDINIYGSEILKAFDDSNRRQTILFRKFCEGMEKHEIHRYFLALLPLANVGNVSIANEESDDGQGEDIAITLLSRRMHHMELDDFGHNEGEHN